LHRNVLPRMRQVFFARSVLTAKCALTKYGLCGIVRKSVYGRLRRNFCVSLRCVCDLFFRGMSRLVFPRFGQTSLSFCGCRWNDLRPFYGFRRCGFRPPGGFRRRGLPLLYDLRRYGLPLPGGFPKPARHQIFRLRFCERKFRTMMFFSPLRLLFGSRSCLQSGKSRPFSFRSAPKSHSFRYLFCSCHPRFGCLTYLNPFQKQV